MHARTCSTEALGPSDFHPYCLDPAFPTSGLIQSPNLGTHNLYYVSYGLPMRYPAFPTLQYALTRAYTVVYAASGARLNPTDSPLVQVRD